MKRIYLLLTALVALSGSVSARQLRSTPSDIQRNIAIFNSIYRSLQTNYVDSIDADKTMKDAIDAMLYAIDPYTEYYPRQDQEELLSLSTGEFGGIGAYIMQNRAGNTVISKPQPGTPSYRAGLRPGDIIQTVDGDTVLTLGSAKVRERLRGVKGTPLTVTVKRPYATADSIITVNMERAAIPVNVLPYYGVVRDTLGYIQLTEFSAQAPDLVRRALVELKKDPRVKAIVLDLRGNGGGLLESAVKIVGLFVPRGTVVVSTKGHEGSNVKERIYRTTNTPVDTEIPLAVLIDNGSASSSEITAGALQDLDRAVIIGNRSYGKGLVQSTFAVPDGGLFKVTTARYYIPSGRLIQAIDYSHRDADGNVMRVPDSLTNVYRTAAGREVRDGGGITPDITVSQDSSLLSTLLYKIVQGNYHFDYATRYAASHPTMPGGDVYTLPDSTFEDFKAWLAPQDLAYGKIYDDYLDNLTKGLKIEGRDTDDVLAQIEALRRLLQRDIAADLDLHRDAITLYLAPALLERYSEHGAQVYELRYDRDITEALRILTDPKRLAQILSAP